MGKAKRKLIENKIEQIAHIVIKVLYSRFQSFPENTNGNRNAPFHTAFLNAFSNKLKGRVTDIPDFISLSSWIHGLNTTLGQTFFESVAHILSDGEKRVFTNNQIYENQSMQINEIMTDLKNSKCLPNVKNENDILKNNANGNLIPAPNFTADCFFETRTEVIAIELKSVRPNSGEMRGEKQKILISKAILGILYPRKTIKYYFGFPFDPQSKTDTGYNKLEFLNYLIEGTKFCAHDEVLIADELWSFLSGETNSMQMILDIINDIATPNFMDEFNFIQRKNYRDNKYLDILNRWHLYTEKKIAENLTSVNNSRILNQNIFRTDGSYNENRRQLL